MPSLPSVAVLGVGSSGLPVVRSLLEAGVGVTAFERGSTVGGTWVLDNDNGMSSAYSSLHINTSRERMQYAAFPMPRSYPDYPHHSHVAEYFRAYADHFGLHRAIRYRTGVQRAEPRDGGGWDVTTDDGRREAFDALVVANGHHWDPLWPEPAYPGHFDGEQRHAHSYRDNTDLPGRRVLVVGMGNSAMDIATEASFVTARTFLSVRRGTWVVPKYSGGRPGDQHPFVTNPRIPWRLKQRLLAAVVKMQQGSLSGYGLPEPEHGLLQQHPTISDVVLSRIAHGEVTPVPGVQRLDGDGVVFTDGTREQVDVVIWCTGYKISFPFFAPDVLSAPDNEIPLYFRTFSPERRDVFFTGLLQPLGAVMPLAELQAEWLADHLRGRYHLLSPERVRAVARAQRQEVARRYVGSLRHTIQVDFDEFRLAVRRERRAGARRATAAGYALPVPGRVGAPV